MAAKPGRGRGTLFLACPASAVEYCRGTFKLTVSGRTIAHGRFKLVPGYVKPVTVTVTGKLLAKLKRKHRLRAELTTNSGDAAKRHNHKKRKTPIQLTYVRAAKPRARS
jgi:hypothetical protein